MKNPKNISVSDLNSMKPQQRYEIATNPEISKEVMKALSKERSYKIKAQLASNKNIPNDILNEMAIKSINNRREDQSTEITWIMKFVRDPEVLDDLSKCDNVDVKHGIAMNDHAKRITLQRLAKTETRLALLSYLMDRKNLSKEEKLKIGNRILKKRIPSWTPMTVRKMAKIKGNKKIPYVAGSTSSIDVKGDVRVFSNKDKAIEYAKECAKKYANKGYSGVVENMNITYLGGRSYQHIIIKYKKGKYEIWKTNE